MAPYCFTVIQVAGQPKTRNAWLNMVENQNKRRLLPSLESNCQLFLYSNMLNHAFLVLDIPEIERWPNIEPVLGG